MVYLVSGRTEPCKNLIGGVKKAWITYFNDNNFVVENDVVTEISETIVLHEFLLIDASPFEQQQQSNDDGKSFNTNISFKFRGVTAFDNNNFNTFIGNRFHILLKDNNGLIHLLGSENGIYCNDLKVNSGSEKADFNGYELTFSGLEKVLAPLLLDEGLINNNVYMLSSTDVLSSTDKKSSEIYV